MPNWIERSALIASQGENTEICFKANQIRLAEIPLLGMVRLQGPENKTSFCQQVAAEVVTLATPGQSTHNAKQWRCIWLARNEWLLVTPRGQEADLIKALTSALDIAMTSATIISDSRLALSISGPNAINLLSQFCSLDLHPSVFVPGTATITRFCKIAALLTCTNSHEYELYIDRAYAGFIWRTLVDAVEVMGGAQNKNTVEEK